MTSFLNWNQVWAGPTFEMYSCHFLRDVEHKRPPWRKLTFFTVHWAHLNESKDATDSFSYNVAKLCSIRPYCIYVVKKIVVSLGVGLAYYTVCTRLQSPFFFKPKSAIRLSAVCLIKAYLEHIPLKLAITVATFCKEIQKCSCQDFLDQTSLKMGRKKKN